MNSLVRAELRKLATVRTTYGLLAAMFALTLAWAALVLAEGGQVGHAPLGSVESIGRAMAAPLAAALVFVLGVLLAAGEFRYETVTSAFLVTPRRTGVIAAKLIAIGIVGVGAALLTSAVGLALALAWLAATGVAVQPITNAAELALGYTGGVAGMALHGMLGAGVGALARNQLVGAVGGVFWLYGIEQLFLATTFPRLVPWLPTGATTALSRGALDGGLALPQWAAGLLLLAYAVGLATAGARLITRSDIT